MTWCNQRFDNAKSYLCIADCTVCCAVFLLAMSPSDRQYGCTLRGGTVKSVEREDNPRRNQ